MTPNHTHEYTIALAPTPEQHAQLRHLSWMSGVVRALAHEQATMAADGKKISIAGLLDADHDHRAYIPGAEAQALLNVPETREAPFSMLVEAIRAGRADYATGRSPRSLAAPHTAIAGVDLITAASPQGVLIDGVTDEVRADIAALPRWAAQLWCKASGASLTLPRLRLDGACLSDCTYIEQPDESQPHHWEMDVMCDWDAYPAWQLMRYAPDDEERITAPQDVAQMMGW